MAFTGAWKTRARSRVLDGEALPPGKPEQAALHEREDYNPPGSRPPYAAQRMAQVPRSVTDSGDGYDPVMTTQAPGLLLDTEPVTHEAEVGPDGAGRSWAGQRSAANRARSVNRGAPLALRYDRPGLDEGQRVTDRLEVLPTNGGSRESLFLGKMGTPESNPEGDGAGGPVRNGFRVQRFYHRRIPMNYRRHELRGARTQLAAAAVSSPAMTGESNRYTSPYGWLQSGRTRTQQSPVMRRVPRQWDEDQVSDGSEVTSPLSPAWGL